MIDSDRENNDIEVELTLLTPEKGGRKKGFPMQFTGPHVYFDGYELSAWFTLLDRETFNPGETARVFVAFSFHPQILIGKLYSDKKIFLHEGYHLIGHGRILSNFNFDKHVEEEKRRGEKRDEVLQKLQNRPTQTYDKHKKSKRNRETQ